LIQSIAVLLTGALAGLLAGGGAALSALAGGAAYVVPNLLFVLRVRLAMATHAASAAGFLVGAAMKSLAVIVVLVLLPRVFEVHWPALIAGLIVVLFVNLFALLLKT